MSEARSLTPLSESDYEAIAEAVMETARGRWFMAEFAKRNRQADTSQLLTAIGRIERAVGVAAVGPAPDANAREAAALIADLRLDLERISGRHETTSSGLAQRIETSSAQILAATETIQEASWRLRESGGADDLCDLLDRRTTEIFAAAAIVEGTAQQIDKIADTIAMLDSSLRAISDRAQDEAAAEDVESASWGEGVYDMPARLSSVAYDEVRMVGLGTAETDETPLNLPPPIMAERRIGSIQNLTDDLVFEDIAEPGFEAIDLDAIEPVAPSGTAANPETEILEAAAAARSAAAATSESELYALDAMPADKKLAYFA